MDGVVVSGVLLRVADLDREPEFHLDLLLAVLAEVPDGYSTERAEVWSGETKEAGWELDTAAGYTAGVIATYQCGWTEEGDGKVLTAITSRLNETEGHLILSTARRMRPASPYVAPDWSMIWTAAVTLGAEFPFGHSELNNPRAGHQGVGENAGPGVAVLLAYLRAWGVLG